MAGGPGLEAKAGWQEWEAKLETRFEAVPPPRATGWNGPSAPRPLEAPEPMQCRPACFASPLFPPPLWNAGLTK